MTCYVDKPCPVADEFLRTPAGRQVTVLARQAWRALGEPLTFIGSVGSCLGGTNFAPRDIDPLVPEGSLDEFFEAVLIPLGYEPLPGGVGEWLPSGAGPGYLYTSPPVSEAIANPLLGRFSASFGWALPHGAWRTVLLDGDIPVRYPHPDAAFLLTLKSAADKVWLTTNLPPDDSEHEHWIDMLARDVHHLDRIIEDRGDSLTLDGCAHLWNSASDPESLAQHLHSAASFCRRASTEPRSQRLLNALVRGLGIRLGGDAGTPEAHVDRGPDAEIPWRAQATSEGQRRYNPVTGAIHAPLDWLADPASAPSAPYSLHVQLNASCPHACGHCWFEMTGEELPLAQLRARLEEAAQLGVFEVNLGEGAEPLLYSWLAEAIEACAAAGLTPNLTSSLAYPMSHAVRAAIERHCKLVAVSIDEFHFRSAARGRVPTKVRQRVEELSKAGVSIAANVVYGPDNLHLLDQTVGAALSLPTSSVCLVRLQPKPGAPVAELPLERAGDVLDCVAKIIHAGRSVLFQMSDPIWLLLPVEASDLPFPCRSEGRLTALLRPDGSFCPSILYVPGYSSGGSLAAAWVGDSFRQFRMDFPFRT